MWRPSVFVGLALLLGAWAAYMAARWAGLSDQAPLRPRSQVVVAASSVEAGTALTAAHVRLVDWYNPELPDQAVQDIASVPGRVTRMPLQAGEPLLEAKLAPVDSRAGLSAVITEGKRAISVKVNEVIGVAGFALPGSHVDVLVSGKDDAQQPFSRVVITRAKVLATAQDTTADPNKPKVTNAVTLELSPAEAELLDLARTVGVLSLVLRNEADVSPWTASGARWADLLKKPQPAPDGAAPAATRAPIRPPPVPAPAVVQEIRGASFTGARP